MNARLNCVVGSVPLDHSKGTSDACQVLSMLELTSVLLWNVYCNVFRVDALLIQTKLKCEYDKIYSKLMTLLN